MSLRSALFGSKLRIAVVVLVVLGVLGGGLFAAGVLGQPTVETVENRFAGVNDSTTVIETAIVVDNPNPLSANLSGLAVDYEVRMNDLEMATGSKEGVSIGRGTSRIPTRTYMRNERIPAWWVSHVRNGEHTDLTINAAVHSSTIGGTFDAPAVTRDVDTDIISQFNSTETRAVGSERSPSGDAVLYVNETSARWGSVTDAETPIEVSFTVYNPNAYPVAMSRLSFQTTMNDVAVGNGTTDREVVIPPGATETIHTTVNLDNSRLDEWWVSHLERNQVTDLRIDFSARLDLATTTVTLPLDPLTYERTIETDVFGTKPADGANSTDGTATATSDGGTATASPSPTSTLAETTDDGDLLGDDSTGSPTSTGTPPSTSTDAPTSTPTDTPASTPTDTPATTDETTTDDGGLLSLSVEIGS